MALQQVEDVRKEDRDGLTYWTYEHLSQARFVALSAMECEITFLERLLHGECCLTT